MAMGVGRMGQREDKGGECIYCRRVHLLHKKYKFIAVHDNRSLPRDAYSLKLNMAVARGKGSHRRLENSDLAAC